MRRRGHVKINRARMSSLSALPLVALSQFHPSDDYIARRSWKRGRYPLQTVNRYVPRFCQWVWCSNADSFIKNPVAGFPDISACASPLAFSVVPEMAKLKPSGTQLIHASHRLDQRQITSSTTLHPSPVSSIPVELLNEIFCYLPSHIADLAPLRRAGQTPRWLAVTQVCQYWRRVAYACRELWAYMPLESKEWTALALELSKDAPIVIDADESTWAQRSAVVLAFGSIARARTIRWTVTDDMASALRAVPQDHPALLLESFEYVFRGDEDVVFAPRIRGPLPRLRELNIDGAMIRAPSSLFASTLTSLTLDRTESWTTAAEMVAALGHLQILEKLVFVIYQAPVPDLQSIALPRLLELSVTGTVGTVVGMLLSLDIPACRRLTMDCDTNYFTTVPEVCNLVASIFTDGFSGASLVCDSYQTLAIIKSDDTHTSTTFVAGQPLRPNSRLPELRLTMRHGYDTDMADAQSEDIVVSHICRSLPLSHLKTLEVDNYVLDRGWSPVLTLPCAELEQITARYDTAYSLFQALRDPQELHSPRNPESFLRALRTIIVEDADFSMVHSGTRQTVSQYFVDALAARNGRFPPCKLVLRRCLVSSDVVNYLANGDVEWSGVPALDPKGRQNSDHIGPFVKAGSLA
ncbi:hypothetical protein BV25DRAFT_724619 [Artomyces pyxidatus]|uniref:Uncharacterized protein n=1 Tax=Artomyces pyxidatus TaxID=48021 RepID=A0ACB8T0I5_9AGAM|nr:hypothetical protein BV25DRAFT_724619 [Artomyces pyxidatus]